MSRSLPAAKIDSSSRHSQQAALLRLPLEIRQKIYAHALVHTMSPSPEKIYFAEEPITGLPPASLYFVNRQIRVELRAAFAWIKGPLILHITPQGAFYSSFSETAILAGRSRDITRASKFVIIIWPPHPDRPVDIFEIWRSAREIQRQLIQAAPLQDLWLQFDNNELASWCPKGRILDTLWPDDSPEAKERDTGWNDITNLARIFCRVRTALGGFNLAPELRMPGAFPETLEDLSYLRLMMKGELAVPELYHNEVTLADKMRYDDKWSFQEQELQLQRQGARIAIKKLTEMTYNGQEKMSVTEWYRFLELWNPHFETLTSHTRIYLWRKRFCRK